MNVPCSLPPLLSRLGGPPANCLAELDSSRTQASYLVVAGPSARRNTQRAVSDPLDDLVGKEASTARRDPSHFSYLCEYQRKRHGIREGNRRTVIRLTLRVIGRRMLA